VGLKDQCRWRKASRANIPSALPAERAPEFWKKNLLDTNSEFSDACSIAAAANQFVAFPF
jgi:hypothetical protein